MSELEQRAKEEFMANISIHLLTSLSDGSEELVLTNKIPGKIGKDGLTKRLKAGSVLSEDYDKNCDTIAEWRRIKAHIRDLKEIIKGQEGFVLMTREDISRIESGNPDEVKPMLPIYKENLEMWQKSLVTKRRKLEVAKIEIKSLKVTIKALKDKFKQYISQLEVAE